MTTLQGGCACGLVRYHVRGSPQICQICHCTFCQRRTGSSFATIAYFNEGDVSFNQGELKQYQHRSDESGRWLRTDFCPTCATTVTHTVEVRPGLRAIAVGTLDDPEQLTIERHIWVQSKRSWVSIPEGTATFAKAATA
jgi:hypothetical protein